MHPQCRDLLVGGAAVAVFLLCIAWCLRLLQSTVQQDVDQEPTSERVDVGGLALAVVRSMPAFQFQEQKTRDGGSVSDMCAICMGSFFQGEWLKLLPNCAHVFHVSCMDTWLRTNSTCPLCRKNVVFNIHDSIPMMGQLVTLQREDASTDNPLASEFIVNQHPLSEPQTAIYT